MFAQLLPCPAGEGRDAFLQLLPLGDVLPECAGDGQALALRRDQRERQAAFALQLHDDAGAGNGQHFPALRHVECGEVRDGLQAERLQLLFGRSRCPTLRRAGR